MERIDLKWFSSPPNRRAVEPPLRIFDIYIVAVLVCLHIPILSDIFIYLFSDFEIQTARCSALFALVSFMQLGGGRVV